MTTSRMIAPVLLALAAASPLAARPLEDLHNLEQLRARFNEDVGIPRLILLMSPTCPVCVAGAKWVQQNLLGPNPSAEIRIFAIWFNMVSGDQRSRWPGAILSDLRAVHLWDAPRTVGRWYAEDPQIRATSVTDAGVVWDTYFLYGPQSRWESTPSDLVDRGSTIFADRQRLGEQLGHLWGEAGDGLQDALATCYPPTAQGARRGGRDLHPEVRNQDSRSGGDHHTCRPGHRH